MDKVSAIRANRLLGNTENAPVLEFTLSGPMLLFHSAVTLAITGAAFKAELNGVTVEMDTVLSVLPGDRLRLGMASAGCIGYLAVAGGFAAPMVLGGVSPIIGVYTSTQVKKGRIFGVADHFRENSDSMVLDATPLDSDHIEVFPGPEFDRLTTNDQDHLFRTSFSIGRNSNRMAYALEHDLDLGLSGIVTGPVQPGTVQLTPSGRLIALMRDAQTTGGYARVLQFPEKSINSLAQLRPGTRFQLIQG
jgi:biotin-dependent carboxylase-like uncharacterized protein